jgi:hypothetical protein
VLQGVLQVILGAFFEMATLALMLMSIALVCMVFAWPFVEGWHWLDKRRRQ